MQQNAKRAIPDHAFPVAGKLIEVPSVGLIGPPGSGKDESHIGPACYLELTLGEADLIVLDAKLEQYKRAVKYGYLPSPEEADVFVFGTAPGLEKTHGFDFLASTNPKPALRMLAREEDTAGTHWQDKAGAMMGRVAEALQSEAGQRPAMAQVAAVVDEPDAFAELRQKYPRIDAVCENPNEMGSVISAVHKALEPVERGPVQRLMGSDGMVMPDLSSPKRQIIFLCPNPGAGDEAKITAAMVDVAVTIAASYPDRVQKFLLNEAASFCALPELRRYIDLYRAQGVHVWYVLQTMHQLISQIGYHKAYAVWHSTACQIVGRGAEPEIARQMSDYTLPARVTHRQPLQHRQDPGGEYIAEETRRELEPHHITGQGVGEWTRRVAEMVDCYETPYEHCQSEYLKRKHRRNGDGR